MYQGTCICTYTFFIVEIYKVHVETLTKEKFTRLNYDTLDPGLKCLNRMQNFGSLGPRI
jgi:hypothetical protein